MQLGILNCDDVPSPLRRRHGGYPDMFRALLGHGRGLTYRVYDLPRDGFPRRPDECDAWLMTGSAASAFDDAGWIQRAHELARDIHAEGRPLIGVCFGHQLIARALGGTVERASAGWGVGVHRIDLHARADWMHPAPTAVDWIVSHRDQVTQPPAQATHLGGSAFCPYGLLQIGGHTLTLQGHPEFRPGFARSIMERRREELGPDTYAAGVESLQQGPDRAMLAGWLRRFLDPSA